MCVCGSCCLHKLNFLIDIVGHLVLNTKLTKSNNQIILVPKVTRTHNKDWVTTSGMSMGRWLCILSSILYVFDRPILLWVHSLLRKLSVQLTCFSERHHPHSQVPPGNALLFSTPLTLTKKLKNFFHQKLTKRWEALFRKTGLSQEKARNMDPIMGNWKKEGSLPDRNIHLEEWGSKRS